MSTPFICLSRKLELTDISPEIKSLSGASLCKDFLFSVLDKDSLDELEEMCVLPHPTSALTLKLSKPLGTYAFVKAVKNLSGGIILYFVKAEDELEFLLPDVDGDPALPADHVFTPQALSFVPSGTDLSSLKRICSRVAARLSSSQLLAGRALLVESDEDISSCGVLSSDIFSILQAAFSLVCAVSRSADGGIRLHIGAGENSLELSVSVQLSVTPPFIGSSDDVLLLAAFLKGSRPFFKSSLLYASVPDARLCFDISPSGILRLTATSIHGIMPTVEFKFPEGGDDEYNITEKLIGFLLSVQEKNDQKE